MIKIQREVVISAREKDSKLPILHEYKHKTVGKVAIAPDAPVIQEAWVIKATSMQDTENEIEGKPYKSSKSFISSNITAKPTKSDEEKTKSLSRTYHTIKDMISSRFGVYRKDIESETEGNLNNIKDESRKSNRSINEEVKKQDIAYVKTRTQNSPIDMYNYSKNTYGQHAYYGYQSNQQNVPLPGQLQLPNQFQPNLSHIQNTQLHDDHYAPVSSTQTLYQSQITAFAQSANVIQNANRDYIIQNSGGKSNPTIHQAQNQISSHNQSQFTMSIKHPTQQSQQLPGVFQSVGLNCQNAPQITHKNIHRQSPRFNQHHNQNLHQRHLIQQRQQHKQNSICVSNLQNTSKNQHLHFSNESNAISNYQLHQQNRQSISRSQVDLPSTSRLSIQDTKSPSQEICYYYNLNRTNKLLGTSQMYTNNSSDQQENEFYRKNSNRNIEKALSQPQLLFKEVKGDNNILNESHQVTENITLESVENKDKCEITVEELQTENFSRNESNTILVENTSETSFGIRSEEIDSSLKKNYQNDRTLDVPESTGLLVQKRIEELRNNNEIELSQDSRTLNKSSPKIGIRKQDEKYHETESFEKSVEVQDKYTQEINVVSVQASTISHNLLNEESEISQKKNNLEQSISRLKINQGSGSDYDKTGQSSNVDSGRGSAVYSSGRRLISENLNPAQEQDAEWVDLVESELRNILEPKDVPTQTHSTLSDSISSVTPPLPPLMPHDSPRNSRNKFSTSLTYDVKQNYEEYIKNSDRRSYSSNFRHRSSRNLKKESSKKFSYLFGAEAGDLTSTTTGLDLDSMLDRTDSDISISDARIIRKQLEGLENMYSEVLKLLGGNSKKRKKMRGLTSYGSISSLPTSSVSSRPITRHQDKRRCHNIDDRIKKMKDVKSINKRFQRLESHVVTLARSVAHLSSEMRTQHLMIQEMENIRGEIAALRTQTNMAMVRSQSQPVIRDSELPALSNPSRVKKLTKFFGTEPPLIRLFLRELGYEKYAGAFEKEKVGMVELPYLSDERLQKMGIPLGPRLRILQEARISVYKDPVYVI